MTVKHETAIAIGGIGDECQCRARLAGIGKAADIDRFRGENAGQVMAEGIIADLAHEGAGIAKTGDSGGDIGGRATGRLDEAGGIAHGHAHLERDKVDQEFAE